MSKSKVPPPTAPRSTTVVRVHKEYARLLKARAKKAGQTIPEYTRRLVTKKGKPA